MSTPVRGEGPSGRPDRPANPFDDDTNDDTGAPFLVVVNAEGQHALWPSGIPVPAGWRVDHVGNRAACLAHVDAHWTDMRPRSLVRAAGGDHGGGPREAGPLAAEQFAAQVARTPDAVGVVFTGDSLAEPAELTYAQLDARANRLAHLLIARGVGPESVVALLLPRSTDLVVAMLAALKAGAAYLPIDAGYPAERIALLRDGCRAGCVLTTAALAAADPTGVRPLVVLDDPAVRADLAVRPATDPTDADRVVPLHPDHPAYVICTSGSTGVPKGITMHGRGLANLLAWHRSTFPGGPGTRTAQLTAIGFDFSVQEILSALVTGRTLVIPPDARRADPAALVEWLDRHRVAEIFAPTAMIDALFAAAVEVGSRLPALTGVFQGGEALTVDGRIREFCRGSGIALHNVYGPAETHAATTGTLTGDPDAWPASASAGPPLPGMRVAVLDGRLRPVPAGGIGEVYLAGVQVARGYRDRPGLTAERFVPDPAGAPGTRMYRSGDLGRLTPTGELEVHGRADDQVKIRGNRVEPGEVEAVVLRHPDVGEAAVVPDRGPSGTRLVAHVAAAHPGGVDPATVRRFVAGLAPDHMVPAAIVVHDELPLTPNGKVDRGRLTATPALHEPALTPARAAASSTEQVLCGLFAELLGLPAVGPRDDFFDHGGHSLLAGRLAGRIRAALAVPASVRLVYLHPTPQALAVALTAPAAA